MADRPEGGREPEAFRVKRDEQGVLHLSGVIDESADLSFFGSLSAMGSHARLNMHKVRRVNSYGVRAWIDAVRLLPRGVTFELLECPPSVVDQLNMVAGFVGGHGRVTSFYAPMACDKCGLERDFLFQVADFRTTGKLPPVACPRCSTIMVVDDLEEQYLMFTQPET